MKKVLLLGWKDLTLAFRDRAALLLMLLAPFALTLGMGLVTGGFSSSGSGLSQIPVVLVDQDGGQLGQALVDLFRSPDLASLVAPEVASSPEEARRQVDEDQAAAAVIVAPGFTKSIIPTGAAPASAALPAPVQIQLYANPTRPTGAAVIRAILEGFTARIETARVGGQVAVTQMLEAGLIRPGEAAQMGQAIAERMAASGEGGVFTLRTVASGGEPAEFNVMAVLAPAFALMFLLYTTTSGGRSLLAERVQGTLPRLLVTPTTSAQVLGGKVFGIYLTGVAQVLILILASGLLFRVRWGSPAGVLLLVLTAVAGATGWGMLLTSLVRSPGQMAGFGSALMLIFGILGGTFINLDNMPAWLAALTRLTPNWWGVQGFSILATGGGLQAVLRPAAALLAMGALLFALAAFIMGKKRSMIQ